MEALKNILWKREKSKKSNSYIDIFNIKGYEVPLSHMEPMFDEVFSFKKNNQEAKAFREDGKKLFQLKKYGKAFKKFEYSLIFSENNSEELGIAYANRSACFFYLNMFEECMIDLDLARKSYYPKHLMHKLDVRESKCREMIKKQENTSRKFAIREPILSFDEHKTYNGVADCLEIHDNQEFGGHVSTKSDLKIGQTILFERPYSMVGTNNTLRGYGPCLYCFRQLRNTIPCDTCTAALFCYDGCMEESFHKNECILSVPGIETSRFQLVSYMLLKIIRDFPVVDKLMKTVELLLKGEQLHDLTIAQRDFCRIFQLAHNHDKRGILKKQAMLQRCGFVFLSVMKKPEIKKKIKSGKYRTFLQHLIFHIFHVDQHALNLFQTFIHREDDILKSCAIDQYATAMYPFASYINHSCVPNVVTFSIDNRLICKVIRPIKKGEQIFRCYL